MGALLIYRNNIERKIVTDTAYIQTIKKGHKVESIINQYRKQMIKEINDEDCLVEAYLQAIKDIKMTDKPYTVIPEYLSAL